MVVMIFGKKQADTVSGDGDFGYLSEADVYMDSACQSLRPQPVIDALNGYYKEFNSCGERVKYKWGREVDEKVEAMRDAVLKLLRLNKKDYFVSFTLNTTYGINLALNQIKSGRIKTVVTSDIEHNSPFLATMAFAKKHGVERVVVSRDEDGSIDVDKLDYDRALLVVNATSNIDGRLLGNISEVVDKIHAGGGLVVIDAAQTVAHHHGLLEGCGADVICFSAHKTYSASLGVMVVKKGFLDEIESSFIGGGMVDDVDKDEYKMSFGNEEHIHTVFEPGLQLFGEIIALGEALKWLAGVEKKNRLADYSGQIYEFLKIKEKVTVVGKKATPTISFFQEGLDSHLLATGLSGEGIMARSGYLCCHYYLDHVMKYPAVLRLSLGYNTRQSDVDKTIKVLDRILS